MIRDPRALPKPETPLMGQNGLMTRDWYDYFREQDRAIRDLITTSNAGAIVLEDFELRITDLETP